MMHKGIKTLLIFCLLLCGCKSQNIEKTKPKKATKELSAEQKLDQKVNQWIDSHGLEEQVLQMFMITPEALTGSESVTGAIANEHFVKSPLGIGFYDKVFLFLCIFATFSPQNRECNLNCVS